MSGRLNLARPKVGVMSRCLFQMCPWGQVSRDLQVCLCPWVWRMKAPVCLQVNSNPDHLNQPCAVHSDESAAGAFVAASKGTTLSLCSSVWPDVCLPVYYTGVCPLCVHLHLYNTYLALLLAAHMLGSRSNQISRGEIPWVFRSSRLYFPYQLEN